MRWTVKPVPDQNLVDTLNAELGAGELVSRLLVQRGITTFEEARRFFRPSLDQLHDPFLMKDMDKAIVRIEEAIRNEENILVFGDYDVDGTTAVSLLYSFLSSIYPNVACYIPDRYEEGYGVSIQGIDFAADNDISLIIALDCGIKAIDKVAYAKEKGIDFIIGDHHRPGDQLPDAVAVLDPKREDCNYPYDELCGCGVAFKIVQGLGGKLGLGIEDLMPYLDLVATAIAADIVPITGENRVLAWYGLRIINSSPRPGIKALTNQMQREFTMTDVVFIIAPRINAAGRMKHGLHAVNLMIEQDLDQAMQFAAEIEQYNADRKDLDEKITLEALEQIREKSEEERYTTVVYNELWHKGVIGIVASRLTETYYRPTLVFTKSGDKLAASARSVKDFDVYNALQACEDFIEQFGGHKYAAGLTLLEQQYEAFKKKFEEVVAETIDKRLLTPELSIDTVIDFEEITPKFYRILKQFAPFGPGNPSPVFMTTGLRDTGYAKGVGQDGKHLKIKVTQNGSTAIDGIGFGLGDKLPDITGRNVFAAAYALDENEWQGRVSLQLKLKDVRLDF
ncbi:single-stranded-DNA-specific exonuclease RecJ [Robertkochia solimangrovi]|uniref:single-stranded-DNA-specific exonuclease RecJ n=1 Tax=Robertkochia solimangrovi TaxID=2213046 RepID=UPI00117D0532|nr:single-stranded-DNA-specific exonuclease RecJ [Robertkochia solimangrovi]TRZ46138.1 single-stranded-DNA-specific exonuclease RecJ [Robertkochia solimangrovi]